MSLIWAAFFQLWHLARGDCWNDIPRTFAAPGKEAHDVWLSKLVEWRDHHLKYHGWYVEVTFSLFFLEAERFLAFSFPWRSAFIHTLGTS